MKLRSLKFLPAALAIMISLAGCSKDNSDFDGGTDFWQFDPNDYTEGTSMQPSYETSAQGLIVTTEALTETAATVITEAVTEMTETTESETEIPETESADILTDKNDGENMFAGQVITWAKPEDIEAVPDSMPVIKALAVSEKDLTFEKYAADYCNRFFENKDEIHIVANGTDGKAYIIYNYGDSCEIRIVRYLGGDDMAGLILKKPVSVCIVDLNTCAAAYASYGNVPGDDIEDGGEIEDSRDGEGEAEPADTEGSENEADEDGDKNEAEAEE